MAEKERETKRERGGWVQSKGIRKKEKNEVDNEKDNNMNAINNIHCDIQMKCDRM